MKKTDIRYFISLLRTLLLLSTVFNLTVSSNCKTKAGIVQSTVVTRCESFKI